MKPLTISMIVVMLSNWFLRLYTVCITIVLCLVCLKYPHQLLYILFGVSKVFVCTRLDRCGLCRQCERVWFWALSKWSSVSGVRCTWGVLLHLSPLLQWALVQPALWPLWPSPQSLHAQLHLPDTLHRNSLLQMPSWWVKTPPQPCANCVFFCPLFRV